MREIGKDSGIVVMSLEVHNSLMEINHEQKSRKNEKPLDAAIAKLNTEDSRFSQELIEE